MQMSAFIQKIDFSNIAASKIYSFNRYDIFRREEGIIQSYFYAEYDGEIEDAINIVETFKILKEDEKCLALLIVEEGATFSKEAREFVASAEVSKIVKADAFVINSLALKILMNGYLKFNKPNRPTRFFNAEKPAVEWLLQI
jgi:hypothetical protein